MKSTRFIFFPGNFNGVILCCLIWPFILFILDWQLAVVVLVFLEGGKPENLKRETLEQGENQQHTQPTRDGEYGESNPGHRVWRRALIHCTNHAHCLTLSMAYTV